MNLTLTLTTQELKVHAREKVSADIKINDRKSSTSYWVQRILVQRHLFLNDLFPIFRHSLIELSNKTH